MTTPAAPPRTTTRRPRRRTGGPVRPVRLAPRDLLSLGLLGLRTRRLRAALSALGISIGVATMVVVTGIPASSQRALMDEISALGSDMLRVQPFQGEGAQARLPEESVDMVRRIGPVTGVSAVANTHAEVQRSDLVGGEDFSGAGLSVLAARRDLLDVVGGEGALRKVLRTPPTNGSPRPYWATRPRTVSASGRSPRPAPLPRCGSAGRGSP
ncbi:ABC transporter permease [Streptomyces sp. PG2]